METRYFEDFEIVDGKEKVMLSAPHAFIHMRDGKVRLGEAMTDKLAKDIAEELKTFAIYKNISSDKDANFDKDCEYKKQCLKTVKSNKITLLIDLHGMKSDTESDICLGVDGLSLIKHDESFLNEVIKIFNNNGFYNVTVDNPFSASKEECISNYIHKNTGIKTMQIEINGKYRLEESPFRNYDGLKKCLLEIIEIHKKMIKKSKDKK